MDDGKNLLSDRLSEFEKSDRSSIRKLLKFCQKHNWTIITFEDKDNPSNPGECDQQLHEIRINLDIINNSNELIIYLLHEIGHMDQLENYKEEMEAKFPGVMSVTRRDLIEKKWKMKTQKYWIDYIGFEQFKLWQLKYSR